MSNLQPLVYEVRITKVVARRGRTWRWDVTYQRPIEGPHPGVYDRRLHMSGDVGHTFTAWGASIAAGRAIRRRASWDDWDQRCAAVGHHEARRLGEHTEQESAQ